MDDKRPQLELVNRDRNTIVSSILIENIYEDGTIHSIGSRYVKVFKIVDINYKLFDDKSLIEEAYKNVLNSSDKNVEISLIINSQKLSKKYLNDKILLQHKNDNLDYLRDGINDTIKKNSSIDTLTKDKYLVIAFTEERNDISNRMRLISNAIKRNFESIANARLIDLTRDETITLIC